jgi:hypothetical protein
MDKAESFCVKNNLYNLGWFILLIVISFRGMMKNQIISAGHLHLSMNEIFIMEPGGYKTSGTIVTDKNRIRLFIGDQVCREMPSCKLYVRMEIFHFSTTHRTCKPIYLPTTTTTTTRATTTATTTF